MPSRSIQLLAFLALTLLLVGWKFLPVWQAGVDRAVPIRSPVAGQELGRAQEVVRRADVVFYTWLSARNARTLIENPFGLFDAEHCAPTPKALALSAPGLTLGLIGIPAALLSEDPILIYNWVVPAMVLLAALAIYLLIVEWTGSAAAGITASLLYGFHAVRLDRIVWIAEVDTTWTVLALLLGRRLFARGRPLDAALLTVVCCLQMATSFYSFLSSLMIGISFLIWLLISHGTANLRWKQWLWMVGGLLVFAVFLFGPYLELRSAETLFEREFRVPMPLYAYLPGQPYFFGFSLWFLVVAACFLGRDGLREGDVGDPRWALVAAGILVLLVAAGWSLDYQVRGRWPDFPIPIPDFYGLLARIVPGLENIRVISLLATGVHLVACVMAGIGAAALIRRAGRRKNWLAVLIVAVVRLEVMSPYWPGFTAAARLRGLEIRPDAESIAFFQELGRVAGPGAIFELPFDHAGGGKVGLGPDRVLLSFYHRRRTSGCYSSYPAAGRFELAQIVAPPLGRESLAALHDQGFTTLVVHGEGSAGRRYLGDLEELASSAPPSLERVLASEKLIAYRILEPGTKRDSIGLER